jgi:hypothetical protein
VAPAAGLAGSLKELNPTHRIALFLDIEPMPPAETGTAKTAGGSEMMK